MASVLVSYSSGSDSENEAEDKGIGSHLKPLPAAAGTLMVVNSAPEVAVKVSTV